MKPSNTSGPAGASDKAQGKDQREALLESERNANRDQPRNFKDDAIDDKVVRVEPDGTGPSPMDSLDPAADRKPD